jgi:hypothetical protein
MADSSVEKGRMKTLTWGRQKNPAAGKNEGMPGLGPKKHANIRRARQCSDGGTGDFLSRKTGV